MTKVHKIKTMKPLSYIVSVNYLCSPSGTARDFHYSHRQLHSVLPCAFSDMPWQLRNRWGKGRKIWLFCLIMPCSRKIPIIFSYTTASLIVQDSCLSVPSSAQTERSSLISESDQFPAIQEKTFVLRLSHHLRLPNVKVADSNTLLSKSCDWFAHHT